MKTSSAYTVPVIESCRSLASLNNDDTRKREASLQVIVFNPTPTPAARAAAPDCPDQSAPTIHDSSQPLEHRPRTALGGGQDSVSVDHAQHDKGDAVFPQHAINGLHGAGQPHFAPGALIDALNAQLHPPPEPSRQHSDSHPSGEPASAGLGEVYAFGNERNARPDPSNSGEGRAAVESMQVDTAPPPAGTSQALEGQPPLEQAVQQWQGNQAAGAWPSQHHVASPLAGLREASLHSAEHQQESRAEQPAANVLTETQEELSKQEPAISTGLHLSSTFPLQLYLQVQQGPLLI